MDSQKPERSPSFRRHLALCGVLVAVVVILAVMFSATPLFPLLLICLAMLGAMVWMMRGGQGHGHH